MNVLFGVYQSFIWLYAVQLIEIQVHTVERLNSRGFRKELSSPLGKSDKFEEGG